MMTARSSLALLLLLASASVASAQREDAPTVVSIENQTTCRAIVAVTQSGSRPRSPERLDGMGKSNVVYRFDGSMPVTVTVTLLGCSGEARWAPQQVDTGAVLRIVIRETAATSTIYAYTPKSGG